MGLLMRFIFLLSLLIMQMSALNVFPKKLRFGEKHSTVILDCKTNKDSVTWKREEAQGAVDVYSEYEKPNGTKLIVYDLQEDQSGNYTCWSDEGLEDYTYLLLDKSKEASGFNLNCTAETLSCAHSLKCSWTLSDYTAYRLRNTRDHGSWVSPSADGVFHVPHTTNPFSEESERLWISGEAVSSCCYIKTDYSFYLRDIVKPAGPNISKCVQRKNKTKLEVKVEVTPPSTWPQPHSFFPLKHQIEYEIRDNGKHKTQEWEGFNVEIQGVISKVRVRCRDPLLLSQWSEWTPWKHVQDKTKGKRRKAKNTKPRHQRKKGRKNLNKEKSQKNHPTQSGF